MLFKQKYALKHLKLQLVTSANKLASHSSCSMRLIGKQLLCSRLYQLAFYISFVVVLSFKSSCPTETKRESRSTVNWSISARAWGDWQDEWELKARTANQFVLTSPVAEKCSVDRPIRTESTESVTDWANRTGAIGFKSLINSCLLVLWHFFQIEHKKVTDVYCKVTNCNFKKFGLSVR